MRNANGPSIFRQGFSAYALVLFLPARVAGRVVIPRDLIFSVLRSLPYIRDSRRYDCDMRRFVASIIQLARWKYRNRVQIGSRIPSFRQHLTIKPQLQGERTATVTHWSVKVSTRAHPITGTVGRVLYLGMIVPRNKCAARRFQHLSKMYVF